MILPAWNEHDLEQLLTLDAAGPNRWASRFGDSNLNGRSYGGQLLGQTMMAALMDVPDERAPTMMQFLFLQGAVPQEPIEFDVTPLQEGKRFSSRRVGGRQAGGRTVLDAQVTCALPIDASEHAEPSIAPANEDPLAFPSLNEMPPRLLQQIKRLGGYSEDRKPCVDFRVPDFERQLSVDSVQPRLRFWMKTTRPLAPQPRVQAAAFAYLSDWWLNFASLGLHLRDIGERKLYVSSLNHAIWLHRPVRADRWLHVDATSPCGANGRGLSVARIHDREGRFVASATQECLMAYAD